MKELKPTKTNTEINQQIDQNVEYRLIGSTRLKRGHKLFAFDLENKIVKEAIFATVTSSINGSMKSTVITEKNFIYRGALNYTNAVIKMFDLLGVKRPNRSELSLIVKTLKKKNNDAVSK